MKKLFTILPLLIQVAAFSQAEPSLGLYKWNTIVQMNESNNQGISVTPVNIVPSKVGQLFRLIKTITSGNSAFGIIQILDYTKEVGGKTQPTSVTEFYTYNHRSSTTYNVLSDVDRGSRNYGDDQKYFIVPINYITSYSSQYLGRNLDISAGVVSLPLKLRLKDGDFSGSVSIAGAGGIKWRTNPYKTDRYHNILIGLGLSNLTMDSASVTKNKDNIVSNLTGLTIITGYLYQSGKIQIGAFLGWDFLTRTNQEKFGWIYQGKPWISLGIGVSIFGDGNKEQNKDTEKKQQK